jgi:hypothetical protein
MINQMCQKSLPGCNGFWIFGLNLLWMLYNAASEKINKPVYGKSTIEHFCIGIVDHRQ